MDEDWVEVGPISVGQGPGLLDSPRVLPHKHLRPLADPRMGWNKGQNIK